MYLFLLTSLTQLFLMDNLLFENIFEICYLFIRSK